MTRARFFAPLAITSAATGFVGPLALPAASADTLPNGLTVTCSPDSDYHTTCIIGGCPRVINDYVVDAVHTTYQEGSFVGSQGEYDFKCINGATARWGVDVSGPFTLNVQACRKVSIGSDMCTPWSSYNYTPPANKPSPGDKQQVQGQPAPADKPSGPDTCAQGYVWREAIPSDHVCVTPDVRSRTQQENSAAADLRDPNGAYGSNSCKQGYVWRNAFNGDAVCVTPDVRSEVAAENAAGPSHLAHG